MQPVALGTWDLRNALLVQPLISVSIQTVDLKKRQNVFVRKSIQKEFYFKVLKHLVITDLVLFLSLDFLLLSEADEVFEQEHPDTLL